MSVLPIVKWPDQRLQTICAPVDAITAEVTQLIDDMFETMYTAPGRGLAAPQVGVLSRLFVMDATWKEGTKTPLVCINPTVTQLGDESSTNEEACLSITGVSACVTRPNKIALGYTDAQGQRVETTLEGFAAICAQHEMDHLEGRVIFDHLSPSERRALETKYEAQR